MTNINSHQYDIIGCINTFNYSSSTVSISVWNSVIPTGIPTATGVTTLFSLDTTGEIDADCIRAASAPFVVLL